MPRRTRKRKVFLPPRGRGWRSNTENINETINLNYDEFEAIKLLDYENLKQEEVAEIMNVSRPTLTRIYNNARKKIARALVRDAHIKISGGNVEVHESWHFCRSCKISFNVYDEPVFCPMCKSTDSIERIAEELDQ